MTESIPNFPLVEPKKHSTGALVIFLILLLPMPLCLLIGHFVFWSMEQSAIMSLSAKQFAWAGPIGLAVQALVMTGLTAGLWRFTSDERFKPVYAGLFGAAVMAFPALYLRTLGPNNDQPGSITQALLALIGVFVVLRLRKQEIIWDRDALPFGLIVAGIGFAPFAIYGSFGSASEVLLSLLASLAFGFLTATLIESTTGNLFLDGVGIGAVLGSAFWL